MNDNEARNLEKEEHTGIKIEGNNVDNVWSINTILKCCNNNQDGRIMLFFFVKMLPLVRNHVKIFFI